MRLIKTCLIFTCIFLYGNIGIYAQNDDIEVDDSTSVNWDDGKTGGMNISLPDRKSVV